MLLLVQTHPHIQTFLWSIYLFDLVLCEIAVFDAM